MKKKKKKKKKKTKKKTHGQHTTHKRGAGGAWRDSLQIEVRADRDQVGQLQHGQVVE